ncbi:TlpA family protein disulfide reductase [Aureibaculum conchae]|uniref:TlpA family protein disulfide reductase n=1 Tax=Aureibaculum sp. 2308TA14-22 TaxID=3108392 RepID=UPI00339B83E3
MLKKITLISFVFLIHCNQKNEEHKRMEKTNEVNGITLIFKKHPHNNVSNVKENIYYSQFYDFKSIILNVDNEAEDTLFLPLTASKICLAYIQFPQSNYYIFHKGDTVIFDHNRDNRPHVKIANRKILKHDFNFEKKMKFEKPLDAFEFYRKFKIKRTKNEKDQYERDLVKYNYKFNEFLDSLRFNNLISDDIYFLNKGRNKYLNINLMKDKINFDSIDKKSLKEDELLYLKTYRYFLENYVLYKYALKNRKEKSLFSKNYEVVFDSIKNNPNFSNRTRKYLLYHFLKKIYDSNSKNISNKYLSIFKDVTNDTLLINDLKNTYLLDFSELKMETKDVYFTDAKKEIIELNDIQEKYKGKLIYIDFWASWCAPCRAAMPASKKLKADYKNKDVVFLYISIDNDFNKWKKASTEEGLWFNKNNILALNYSSANFYKDLKLSTIPRYLLYDKKGKLVHQNAPGPEGKEIRELLDKYLEE